MEKVMKFFGFAIADSMFPADCTVKRNAILSVQEVRDYIADAQMCVNPSHQPTLEVAKVKYGLEIQVPEKAPQISLKSGDSVVVMSVRGLPRLEGRHEYTTQEIEQAKFAFGLWTVE